MQDPFILLETLEWLANVDVRPVFWGMVAICVLWYVALRNQWEESENLMRSAFFFLLALYVIKSLILLTS